MIKNLIFFVTVFALFIGIAGCGSDKEKARSPRIRKLTKVVSPRNGLKTKLGEPLAFDVQASQDTVQIDSFQVKLGTELIYSSTNSVIKLNDFNRVGRHTLFFTVHLSNGKKESHSRSITFLSDLSVQKYSYTKINTFTHDPDSYIEGLIYEDGVFYESTGQRGESTLRRVDPMTGQVLHQISLDDQYFGEGISIFGDKIYMLTYKARKGFIFNKDDFSQIGEFDFSTAEGWGMTTIGDSLVMGDGTEILRFLDPETLNEVGQLQVYDDNGPRDNINELEYINGDIYANIWQTDLIIIIDSKSGRVKGEIDLSGIFNKQNYARRLDVLNGIAYDEKKDRLFVTGKYWPKLYEIDIIPKSETTL